MFGKYHARRKAVFTGLAVLLAFAFSSCETGSDPDSTIPLAGPRSIQVTAGNGSLLLQWTKVAPAQGIIPSYDVYYSTSANSGSAQRHGNVQSNTSNLVQYTIAAIGDPPTPLTNTQTYYVWVKAVYDGLGTSDFSPVTYGTPIPPPNPPAGVSSAGCDDMLELAWTADESAFTYNVFYAPGSSSASEPPANAEVKTVSSAGAVIFGLSAGTYTAWVQAENTAGKSQGYARIEGTVSAAASAPAAPPAIKTVTPGNKKLTLSWDQVSGVPSYKIFYGTVSDTTKAQLFAETIKADSPAVTAELTGLGIGTTYYVWVKSSNSQGDSDFSTVQNGIPVAPPPIAWNDLRFELGEATAEYVFAQDLPKSVFFPDGRPNTDRLTRVQETTLGNLFTDGVAWYVRTNYPDEKVDFVFINGGLIDNALPRGKITVGGFSGIVQPDSRGDNIAFVTLSGKDLKLFFEDTASRVDGEGDVSGVVHSGRGGPHNTGFFGAVSKEARYTIQYYQPPGTNADGTYNAEGPYTGDELTSLEREEYLHGFIKPGTLKINGQDIDDNTDYRVCTTDYLMAGEYFTILLSAGKNPVATKVPFWHGVAEYIYDQQKITPALDGRIKVEGGVPLPAPWIPGDLVKP